jgi:ubiquinone biosynthesis protein
MCFSELMRYWYHKKRSLLVCNIIEHLSRVNILYIKLFQAVASNNALFDEVTQSNVNNILIKYTDNVPYTDNDIDKQTLKNIQEKHNIYFYNDLIPINSGMISLVFKVYKVTNNKRIPFILKIKRNNIDQKLEDSINDVKAILYYLNCFLFIRNLKLTNIIEKNIYLLKEQLDFKIELNNIKKFGELSNNIEYLIIPQSYPNITEEYNNVIMMDFIEGTRLELILLEDKRYYAKNILKILFLSVLSGVIHGDLHSGNLLFIKTNLNSKKICLLDFGIVVHLNKITHSSLLNVIQNLYELDSRILSIDLLKIIITNTDLFSKNIDLIKHQSNLLDILVVMLDEIKNKNNRYNIFKYFDCMNEIREYILAHQLYKHSIELNDEFYKLNVIFGMGSSIINQLCNTDLFILINEVCKEMFHDDLF